MKTLDVQELAIVTGGMRWQDFPLSKNVEDRRPEWAKQRDDQWFRQMEQRDAQPQTAPTAPGVPLPPRRPAGI